MKEAHNSESERALVEDENRAGMDTGKRREIIGSLLVARAAKQNTLPDTACAGLHHWRNRSSSKT